MTTITRKEASEILGRETNDREKITIFLDSIFYDRRDECVVNVSLFVRAAFLYYSDDDDGAGSLYLEEA